MGTCIYRPGRRNESLLVPSMVTMQSMPNCTSHTVKPAAGRAPFDACTRNIAATTDWREPPFEDDRMITSHKDSGMTLELSRFEDRLPLFVTTCCESRLPGNRNTSMRRVMQDAIARHSSFVCIISEHPCLVKVQ